MPAPTTMNGHPVIASFATPAASCTRPGYVLLVQKPDEFVTAWAGEGDNQWCWGHYIRDRAKAEADYRQRCARGY